MLALNSAVGRASRFATITAGEKDSLGASFVSPTASSRSVQSHIWIDKSNNAVSNENALLTFSPPYVMTSLKNNDGQRIVEVCIWLQSGVGHDDIAVWVADDNKHLHYQVMMDRLMGNGWGLHSELVPNGHKLNKTERNMNVRVHHWNTLIDDMRNSDGGLPSFSSLIPLPEEACSKNILRKSAKESRWGAKMLTVDILIEDTKKPPSHAKRSFDMVEWDDMFDEDDGESSD